MDEKEIRALLGLDDDADIGDAIRGLQSTIVAQKAVIATDAPTAEKAELAQLRSDLADARGKLIIEQSENARKIAAIENEARKDRVVAKVERAIASGKPPVMREQMLDYGMMVTPDKFDEFLATIPTIDMTERGVASGSELAELEPSQNDIAVAKSMGIDTSTNEWRLGVMRTKAQERGLKLPAEVA